MGDEKMKIYEYLPRIALTTERTAAISSFENTCNEFTISENGSSFFAQHPSVSHSTDTPSACAILHALPTVGSLPLFAR